MFEEHGKPVLSVNEKKKNNNRVSSLRVTWSPALPSPFSETHFKVLKVEKSGGGDDPEFEKSGFKKKQQTLSGVCTPGGLVAKAFNLTCFVSSFVLQLWHLNMVST